MFQQPSSQIFDTSFDLDKVLMARDAAKPSSLSTLDSPKGYTFGYRCAGIRPPVVVRLVGFWERIFFPNLDSFPQDRPKGFPCMVHLRISSASAASLLTSDFRVAILATLIDIDTKS